MAIMSQIQGAGLGLKRELIPQIQALYGQEQIANISFVEIAPENWIDAGERRQSSWNGLQNVILWYAMGCVYHWGE